MPRKKSGNFDQQKYNNEYNNTHYSRQNIRFHLEKDADIIEKLNNVPNKADYVRQLIRADIAKDEK